MKRKIILGVALLIVVIGGIAAWKYFEKATNYATEHPDITVSSKELVDAFNKDTAQANGRFKDKIVRITGNVKSLDSSAVVLGEEGNTADVVVGLDERNLKGVSAMKIGQQATLQGKFSGYTKSSDNPDDLISSLGGITINIDYAGVVKKN